MKHEYLDYIKKESKGTEYEVSDNVLNFADQILSILHYQPKMIYPTGRNSIQFEYESVICSKDGPEEYYLEFEVFEDYVNIYQDLNFEETEIEDATVEDLIYYSDEFCGRFM